ncbi:MAG: CoA transferase, partial [Actinomycetes bacterium]
LDQVFATRGVDDWAKLLADAGVPAARINNVSEALAHPQVQARGMVAAIDHPTAGALRTVASPIKLSDQPTTVHRAPPLLGQHTDEILAELGFDAGDVERLHRNATVR